MKLTKKNTLPQLVLPLLVQSVHAAVPFSCQTDRHHASFNLHASGRWAVYTVRPIEREKREGEWAEVKSNRFHNRPLGGKKIINIYRRRRLRPGRSRLAGQHWPRWRPCGPALRPAASAATPAGPALPAAGAPGDREHTQPFRTLLSLPTDER